jgi:hypothetical protein
LTASLASRRSGSWPDGLRRGDEAQILLGITGSGKTFAIANVIAEVDRPTLKVMPCNSTDLPQCPSTYRERQLGVGAGRRARAGCPLTAARKTARLRGYHQRLVARGKLRTLALVASIRTLLHAIYSVAINRRAFEPRLPEAPS